MVQALFRSALVTTAVLLALAPLARAQSGDDAKLPPMPAPSTGDAGVHVGVDQISSARAATVDRTGDPVEARPPRPDLAQQPSQIGVAEVAPPTEQVSRSTTETGTAQLAPRDRSAEAAAALSSRGDSRPAATLRLEGRDRCDDAAAGDLRCAAVIETRAASYDAPERPTLSPEQRLLVDQRVRVAPAGPLGAAQRLGSNDIDATAPGAQAIASVALAAPEREPDGARAGAALGNVDPQTIDLIGALVEGLGVTPGTPIVRPPQ